MLCIFVVINHINHIFVAYLITLFVVFVCVSSERSTMGDEIDEQPSAWHDDFTTASQWEIFIAKLEEAIYDWKLPQLKSSTSKSNNSPFYVTGQLKTEETTLFFSGEIFVIVLHIIRSFLTFMHTVCTVCTVS